MLNAIEYFIICNGCWTIIKIFYSFYIKNVKLVVNNWNGIISQSRNVITNERINKFLAHNPDVVVVFVVKLLSNNKLIRKEHLKADLEATYSLIISWWKSTQIQISNLHVRCNELKIVFFSVKYLHKSFLKSEWKSVIIHSLKASDNLDLNNN